MGNVLMEARQIRYGSTNVEEALKNSGGSSELVERVDDLEDITSGNFDFVAAETEVGTFNGEKRYRRIVDFGPITPVVNKNTDIVLFEDNTIKDVIKVEGNFTTGLAQCQLPLIVFEGQNWFARVYYLGEDADPNNANRFHLQFKAQTTDTVKGFAIIYYTKKSDNR